MRYRAQTDRIFSHFAFAPFFFFFFFALLPPNNPENQNLEKVKKALKISSFQVYCYHEWQSNDVDSWLRYEAQQIDFFVILGNSFPFYITNKPTNQNFEKMEKALEDIHHLHFIQVHQKS